MKTVSLFSGAGGLDIGAIKAGANIIWANDIMKDACATYKKNIGDHIVCGDLNEHLEELSELQNVDLVIGGPPCQGFSVAGKMNPEDPRSQMIWAYQEVVSIVNPRAFILENVKALGALSKWEGIRNQLLDGFRKLGYSTSYIVLNATDFDVPQVRERVFVVGFKGDINMTPNLHEMMQPYKRKAKTVRDTLSFLDKAGFGNNISTCNAKITLAATPVLRKSPYAGMLFNGLGRPLKIDGYSATLPASMGGNKTPIVDERELYNKEQPWIVRYHESITADPTKAKFELAPQFLRRLTVEEAAAIQTFPNDYQFQGSQCSKYTQIGNAVPCNLGYAVCQMVADVLNKKVKITPTIGKQTTLKL